MAEPHRGTNPGPYTPARGHAAVPARPAADARGVGNPSGTHMPRHRDSARGQDFVGGAYTQEGAVQNNPGAFVGAANNHGGQNAGGASGGMAGMAHSSGVGAHRRIVAGEPGAVTSEPGSYVASALPPSWSVGRTTPEAMPAAGGSWPPSGGHAGAAGQHGYGPTTAAGDRGHGGTPGGATGYDNLGPGGGRGRHVSGGPQDLVGSEPGGTSHNRAQDGVGESAWPGRPAHMADGLGQDRPGYNSAFDTAAGGGPPAATVHPGGNIATEATAALSSRYFTPTGADAHETVAAGQPPAGHGEFFGGGSPQPGLPDPGRLDVAGGDVATRQHDGPARVAAPQTRPGGNGAPAPSDVVTLEALTAAADRGAAQRATVTLNGVAQAPLGHAGATGGAANAANGQLDPGQSGERRYAGSAPHGPHRAGVSQLSATSSEALGHRSGRDRQDGSQAPVAGQGRSKRPVSGVALAGFITAFVAAPVGLVLSLCGLGLTSKGHVSGRSLAIWGTVISLILSSLFVYAGLQAYKMGNQLMVLRQAVSDGLPNMTPVVGTGGSSGGGAVPESVPKPGAAVRADADQGDFLAAIRSKESVELTEFGSADLVGAGIAICMAQVAGRDPLAVLPDMLNVTEPAAQVVYYAAVDHLCVR